MKKKFLLLSLFISHFTFSQTDFKFYKSIEDYANNKFIPNYDIIEYSWRNSDFTEETLRVKINNSGEKKIKITEFPGEFYSAEKGQLWRQYKKESYIILAYGTYCYYVTPGFSSKPEYYSETISGPIKRFSIGLLEKKLKEKGLFQQFKKDKPKREFKDNVNDYFNKEVKRNIKYFNLLNETYK
ncbi:hypothetical protein [Flavobacterium luminosum]|uniref:GLPGLI family protein n=1 Tax=Flavobacterium luminosum TaxID=2949086 RepID=A0ABT0TRE2_9FLAO|nr:hypothetical protein [Flavobacterium sp. HXWNR70]MCL9810072.1 hypothetical protein [Flavobacterium sp. HXWNR70]